MRGIRLNLSIGGTNDSMVGCQRFRTAAERIKGHNWHAQMYTSLAMSFAITDLVAASPVPVVCDHFGGIQAEFGPQQPGFAELVELVQSGQAYVKLSDVYPASTLAPAYGDVVPFIYALIAATPDHLVWGTEWPHPNSNPPPRRKPTDVTPLYQIDDGRLLIQLPVCAPDAAMRKKILVDNAARLHALRAAARCRDPPSWKGGTSMRLRTAGSSIPNQTLNTTAGM